MTADRRDPVAVVEQAIDPPIRAVETALLRRAAGELMDQAMAAVRRVGLDLDDCVLERSVRVAADASGRGASWFELEAVTGGASEDALRGQVLGRGPGTTEADSDGAIWAVAVRIRAIRMPDYPSGVDVRS